MKLLASLMCRNELGRYLKPCVENLFEFCDTVVAYDDASEDGSLQWLLDAGCKVSGPPRGVPVFFEHEGKARQILLDAVLEENPTYVLAIDADEFVDNGHKLRDELERTVSSLVTRSLCMQEIWTANEVLGVRWDGLWCPHEVPIVWSPLTDRRYRQGPPAFKMGDKKLACPRTPVGVRNQGAVYTGVSILHFGWTNVQQRQQRYDRYMEHDKGKHHNLTHLKSIMFNEHKVHTRALEWPQNLHKHQKTILGAVNQC